MFTGIIQNLGPLRQIEKASPHFKILIDTGFSDLTLGESIACNGVCLTVAEFNAQGNALFFVSPETLDKTNLGKLALGDSINLERALTLNTRLSGHLVQGHVDGLARLISVTENQDAFELKFEIARELSRYCVSKGSIALNGISLTINSLADEPAQSVLSLMIIPHTWNHTNLSRVKVGESVNLEVDLLAKYMERLTCRT